MMTTKTLLYIFGTRPEAIKLAPLIIATKQNPNFKTVVCITAQHREMLDQVLGFFGIIPDIDLGIMKPGQDLFDITSSALQGLKKVMQDINPALVIVQGDTATTFTAALAAFYLQIKVAHIEAGLRSYNKYAPFPEEVYRVLVSRIADYNFAPTKIAAHNLEIESPRTECSMHVMEHIKSESKKNIHLVGNTVIDALYLGLNIIANSDEAPYYNFFHFLDFQKRIILITGHRRENFGEPFKNFCNALEQIAESYPEVQLVYPVHLNPNVKKPVHDLLQYKKNIYLLDPLDYPKMIWLMEKAYLIITDSGGIQEEGPALGKPVLVTREVTERPEGVQAGTALLVGTDPENIVKNTKKLLDDEATYSKMANAINPYGDGTTCQQILDILEKEL